MKNIPVWIYMLIVLVNPMNVWVVTVKKLAQEGEQMDCAQK
jgi:hypothetical protein